LEVRACLVGVNLFAAHGAINPAGMSVLRKINPDLQAKVAAASLPLKDIRSRSKPWLPGDNPFQTLLELNIESEIRAVGGKTEEDLIVDGEVMCYAIMRGALQVRAHL